jgi:hypothetical protein
VPQSAYQEANCSQGIQNKRSRFQRQNEKSPEKTKTKSLLLNFGAAVRIPMKWGTDSGASGAASE